MDPALQRRVQRYGWDKASLLYESYWQQQLLPAQDLLMDWAALKPGEKVLDTACGTGLVSFRVREIVGPGGQVVGTDISDKMIDWCRSRMAREGAGHMEFERMDAESLTLPDKSFDKALCALGLMYMPEPIRALKEMHRVLKTGGLAVAVVWGRRDRCGWASLFEIVDKRVASEVCPLFFQLGNPGMLEKSFEVAGFQQVECKTISATLHFDNAGDACGAAFAGGPVALAYHKFSEQVKEEAHAEYLASVAAYQKGSGYEIPGEFVVARGIAG